MSESRISSALIIFILLAIINVLFITPGSASEKKSTKGIMNLGMQIYDRIANSPYHVWSNLEGSEQPKNDLLKFSKRSVNQNTENVNETQTTKLPINKVEENQQPKTINPQTTAKKESQSAYICEDIMVTNEMISDSRLCEKPPKPESTNLISPVELIQRCPDEWIENRMPGPLQKPVRKSQYFIIDGKRVEIEFYDTDWINLNCSVSIQYVY